MDKPKDIDTYIDSFPSEIQQLLQLVRITVHKAAINAEETISYGMPAFKLNGNLVYFAAFKNHIGFYALPSGNKAFQKELSQYKTGKGSIQFPYSKPLPLDLITKIVKFRIKENQQKADLKKVKK
ncbi:iron chaperone [Flavobacterium sp. NRK1]|uniref:iron chaperone n=1 Tax=Flavobacterium sp. NRK1 TaxID=2954929 RepID=UPI002091F657|nr:DUF1801 domain-containing protein [Flavobacterium sp. NRK1]MCO6146792.1 DUF1801 domain-containing protein [Flavobacterium sp. NRK1]